MAVFIVTGTQSSVGTPLSVPTKPGAATPTTVNGVPLSRIVEPTIVGSPAKRVRQKSYCRTATGAPLRTSSSARPRSRPSAGRTPNTSKKLPATSAASTISLRSAPTRLRAPAAGR